jgi:hypothetical protein
MFNAAVLVGTGSFSKRIFVIMNFISRRLYWQNDPKKTGFSEAFFVADLRERAFLLIFPLGQFMLNRLMIGVGRVLVKRNETLSMRPAWRRPGD